MSTDEDEVAVGVDDDDWIETDRRVQHQVEYPAAVSIRLSWRSIRVHSKKIRGAPLAWADEHGPRFKVMIGGRAANKVRLVPAKLTGRYEVTVRKSGRTGVIGIGTIDCWARREAQRDGGPGHLRGRRRRTGHGPHPARRLGECPGPSEDRRY